MSLEASNKLLSYFIDQDCFRDPFVDQSCSGKQEIVQEGGVSEASEGGARKDNEWIVSQQCLNTQIIPSGKYYQLNFH